MDETLAVLTAASILLVIYHHVFYPLFLRAWVRRCPDRDVAATDDCGRRPDQALPRVAIVIPAFNEAGVIADKICNLAALDYPADRLEVILACDGCTDRTADRALAAAADIECRELRLVVHQFPVNRGKLTVLNEILPTVDADLIALSDASALISIDALRLAAQHFSDPRIGVVCATYRLLEPASVGEALYWDYQVRIKQDEAAFGMPLGAHGAFYVFRRRLFRPLQHDTINDDFVLPMTIVMAGYRAVYDLRMVAVEAEGSEIEQDFQRRKRIAAGNMQQVIRLRRLLLPRYGAIAFTFASGKGLRAIMPFLLLLSFGGSLALAPFYPLSAAAAAAQCLSYALAVLRHLLPGRHWPGLVESIYYLVSGHFAGLIGGCRYLVRLERRGWSGTASATGVPAAARVEGNVLSMGRAGRFASVANGAGRWSLPSGDIRRWLAGGRRTSHVHPLVAIFKRALDVGLAALLLALTAPLFPLTALAIRLDSKGPVLFRQLRVGEWRPDCVSLFLILKFRTMRADAEAITGAVWAAENDPRITRVGRWLRKSRLDELPQLINVLRGEMSLVGPRPERPGIFRWLDANIPYYGERTYGVKPGITGFAQVSHGYDRTLDDVRCKLHYDHAYALALSRPRAWLALDLQILAQTLLVMARSSEGAERRKPEILAG
jgi:lipopolysaccharide/colanic/teichoic acid biosynthesis glycosyltransferase/cellulose synthase/poly-beta-1,6-N-acetylglucosamine synthase-like glycosyltransferase